MYVIVARNGKRRNYGNTGLLIYNRKAVLDKIHSYPTRYLAVELFVAYKTRIFQRGMFFPMSS